MAQQDIIIGAQDAGNGDNLFQAFTKVQANFNELYSDDLADVNSIIEGTGISVDQATGDVTISLSDGAINEIKLEAINTPSDDMVLTYDSATGGFEWRYDYQSSPDNTTIGFDGSNQLEVKDNGVDHQQLSNSYTALSALGTGSAFAIDFDTATTFTATANAAATLTMSNAQQGQVVDVIISGNFAITLAETGATFNKVGTTAYDGTTTNIIQIICTDDSAGAKVYHYAVSTYAAGATV